MDRQLPGTTLSVFLAVNSSVLHGSILNILEKLSRLKNRDCMAETDGLHGTSRGRASPDHGAGELREIRSWLRYDGDKWWEFFRQEGGRDLLQDDPDPNQRHGGGDESVAESQTTEWWQCLRDTHMDEEPTEVSADRKVDGGGQGLQVQQERKEAQERQNDATENKESTNDAGRAAGDWRDRTRITTSVSRCLIESRVHLLFLCPCCLSLMAIPEDESNLPLVCDERDSDECMIRLNLNDMTAVLEHVN